MVVSSRGGLPCASVLLGHSHMSQELPPSLGPLLAWEESFSGSQYGERAFGEQCESGTA